MGFESRRFVAWDAESQRGRHPVTAEPAPGGERLNQAIGAPRQAGGHTRDYERHPIDQRGMVEGKVLADGRRRGDRRSCRPRIQTQPGQPELDHGEQGVCGRRVAEPDQPPSLFGASLAIDHDALRLEIAEEFARIGLDHG